ncbi:restriction endonuclease subunit S [Escherichia coli]|uniref:Restriction endonuclease subunit S n=5 Tax=Escherichia coli TaxID=562 RepID=A0A2X9KVK2_ECOLX|nr:restriction endonuclease subunit S [Escherichia coli]EEZ7064942.1 restriction endonuclease subunit S [Escherichia coli O17]EEZ9844810.1 restriction endonuclease subunit S [Escherichia coli O119]EFO2128404.1 restriction endonuclease subunit S [Escherichia coli O100]EFT1027275.1 restriction endonuclease subunit S [Shigella sonnei]AJB37519.1 restriction modification system DNA specificity domain-containing protein [Escherichia coli APEC IMT5155]
MGSNAITTIIGEHLLIRNGKSSPSRAITGEYPVYGSNGIIGYSDEYNANENTIIIGRVGSYCGSVYISGKKCWVTDNAIIGTAKNENESHFWFYLLKKIDLNNYSTGSGQPLINQTIINTISVTIPKLSEKRVSIGHFLRHFDQKINLSLNINQSLEQMSQTLFKSWFVDFDPVIDNALDAGNPIPEALQSRAELRQKVRSSADFKPLLVEIRSLFPSEFEETELGWVPKGWTLKSVAKSININPSIKLPKNKIAKYVDMKSLPTQGYSISDIIEKPYSGGAKFQNNDTLFARITPCLENGKTGFVDFLDEKETAFGSTEFIVMRGTPQVHYLYVACLARENNFRLHAIQNMVGSSGRQRVQNSCFDSFYIAIPTPAVMSLFSGKVSSYFDKMYFCNLENKSLTALRDTLLPKLISGELSLDDLPDLTTDTEAA